VAFVDFVDFTGFVDFVGLAARERGALRIFCFMVYIDLGEKLDK
jgi:hypothetical protein